jgi:hypothetical protein
MVASLLLVGAMLGTGASGRAATRSRDLPPSDHDALVRIFDPLLKGLGLHTTRASLQSGETYAPDPHGTHLAVYVAPMTNSYTDAKYVTNFVKVARVFLPMVFDRWKGLESFDVCQEPRPGVTNSPEPAPITQILVSRRGLTSVGWPHATLTDVVIAANRHLEPTKLQREFAIYLDTILDKQPKLIKARAAADAAIAKKT